MGEPVRWPVYLTTVRTRCGCPQGHKPGPEHTCLRALSSKGIFRAGRRRYDVEFRMGSDRGTLVGRFHRCISAAYESQCTTICFLDEQLSGYQLDDALPSYSAFDST